MVLVDGDKSYCDYCGKYIPENDKNQLWFAVDNFVRHYCSCCASYGEYVQKTVERKIKFYKLSNRYYETGHVFKMVEALHKNKIGKMKISFANNFNYSRDIIGSPIIKDDAAVGVITDVNRKEVTGYIWNRYMPVVAEIYEDKSVSFEIVY